MIARQAGSYIGCMMRDISHQGTGVDVSCNQEVSMTVLPLLCKRDKQRDERHIIESLVSAKNLGYGDLPLQVVNRGGKPILNV